MFYQSFNAPNLKRMIQPKDFFTTKSTRTIEDFEPFIARAEQLVQKRTLDFEDILTTQRRGKDVHVIQGFSKRLIVRKLTNTIARVFKLRQANRNQITRTISVLLKDQSRYGVVKLDIASFYESIPKSQILQKLSEDRTLSHESKWVLETLFSSAPLKAIDGLPRGISLCAALSELYAKRIDATIRRMRDVFFYGRFVDDLIVFTTSDPRYTYDRIVNAINRLDLDIRQEKEGLYANRNKPFLADVYPGQPDFDYLGYNFFKKDAKSPPSITISEKKIRRLKSRITKSFLAYTRDQDATLLKLRIRYLTSNVSLTRHSSETAIRSGIYYSYQLANDSAEQLTQLDTFLRAHIFSKNNIPCKRNTPLLASDKATLSKFSFLSGYRNRITHKMRPAEIAQIKRCWQND